MQRFHSVPGKRLQAVFGSSCVGSEEKSPNASERLLGPCALGKNINEDKSREQDIVLSQGQHHPPKQCQLKNNLLGYV